MSSHTTDTFQHLSPEIAEMYEAGFVPQLFARLAPPLLDAAEVGPGQRVLDVACGTGIVARLAADRVGATGRVTGLDLNESMLTVARRVRPDLEWRQGDAVVLPFDDACFDVVTCQSGLMFVPEPDAALGEMARVLAAGGRVAIQLWSAPERQAGFRPFAEAVARHAGPDAVRLVSTYFRLGDPERFSSLCRSVGLTVTGVRRMPITLHSPSIDEYVTTEVESTPLVARITDEVYDKIRADARIGLAQFCTESGELAVPLEVYFVTAVES